MISSMRIAVVSDVHGNLTALEAVLTDLRDVSPDLVVQGGDLVAGGSSPAAVIDIVRELAWPGIQGNTDEMLWRPERLAELAGQVPDGHWLRSVLSLFASTARVTCDLLGAERLAWMQQLPLCWRDHDLAIVHATEANLWRAPLANAADEELRAAYGPLGARRVVYAHIHHPFVRGVAGLTIANAGSVSLSYDGDPRASYAVVDDDGITIRRVRYDVEEEIARLNAMDYPGASWQAQILRAGRFVPPG
jgi:putative phosphoesterase